MSLLEDALSDGLLDIARAEVIHVNAMRQAGSSVSGVEFDVAIRSEMVDHPRGVIVIIKQTYHREDIATISVGIAVRVWIRDRDELVGILGEDWRDIVRVFVTSLYDKLCKDTAEKVMDTVGVVEGRKKIRIGPRLVSSEDAE